MANECGCAFGTRQVCSWTYSLNKVTEIIIFFCVCLGQGRFCTIIRSYSRGAQGVILVYDITNKWSFDGIDRWLKEVEEVGFFLSTVFFFFENWFAMILTEIVVFVSVARAWRSQSVGWKPFAFSLQASSSGQTGWNVCVTEQNGMLWNITVMWLQY